MDQRLANEKPEDRITQEFELLVICWKHARDGGSSFVHMGAVGQRELK
jgi:hypothetical protein